MRHVKRRLFLTVFLFLLAKFSVLHAQACVEDYFYADINTLTVQQPNSTLVTSENEIAVAGDVFRYNSVLKEGWVTKYSARGTILWTRRYYTSAYNYVAFNNIVEAENGSFLITGHIGDVDTSSWPVTPITRYGLVMKIDKYGAILWSKAINQVYTFYFPFLSDIQSTINAKNGDYILTLSHFNQTEYTDYRLISRIDKDGNIKWMTALNSSTQRAATGSSNVAQLKNNDIFFITNVSQFSDKYFYLESGLYMASLDYNTGEKKWERFYVSEDSLIPTPKAYGNITGITELDNGDISFITSYSGNALKSFRPTTEVLNFVLDSLGNFPRIKSYGNGTKPFYASASVPTYADGSRIVLMDNADVPYLMEIRRDGTIKWQKSYGAVGRAQETRSVLHTGYGNYIFMFTHDGGSKTLKLIKTDSVGSVPCIENTASIQMKDPEFRHYIHTLKMVYTPSGATWNTFTWLNSKDYTMTEDFKCRKACCTDVTDTTTKISLCDKPYYLLPNADTVKSSGTYSVVFKASTGCDSIVYYPVDFGFTPSVTAGRDRCMGEKDTIMLSATSGYDTYYWNNMISYNKTYVVQQPGTYIVNVSERCGSSMDTVQVYKECEFEIKMPNAFTPNGDNKNDIFRVPPQIYNRLLRFTVYNRWGQMMFTTTDMSKGWDGRFNGQAAPAGTYVYYVVMRSLDNRRDITSKGYVTLLR